MWWPQNFFRRSIYNPVIFPRENNRIIYIAATDFVKLMCHARCEKCYNRVVSYLTDSPFKCHNSANIYGMNRIARIRPTYLNMQDIYGINLIVAKGLSPMNLICANVLFTFFYF